MRGIASGSDGAVMEIRVATLEELRAIEQIYSEAREFMRAVGNGGQWGVSYPSRDIILGDIEKGALYCVYDGGEMLAVFFADLCVEPTYKKIYDGEWRSPSPCGVIHRVAVSAAARGRGAAAFIFSKMAERFGNLRIDTHKNNIPMQRALEKCGFAPCGRIYIKNVENMDKSEAAEYERIAYERLAKE